MLGCFRDLPEDAILYEDEDVIVLDKPAGVACQAIDAEHADDLPARLRRHLAARRGVPEAEIYVGTHQRLDQDTSGVILYTLRKEANAAIAEQFEARSLEKTYVAAVRSDAAPRKPRTLVDALAMDREGRVRVVQSDDPQGKVARTRIETLRSTGDRALLRADIETGRTHQIRVQLEHVGLPIAGDPLYGGAPALRLMLHAQRIAFRHPRDGHRVEVEAPVPLEIEDWLSHGDRPAHGDERLLERALRIAIERRFALGLDHAEGRTTAFRLLHEAGDGFPGLTADVYAQHLVLRVVGEVADADVEHVLDALARLDFAGVYLKRHPKQASDMVDPRDERVAPALPVRGTPAPEVFEVLENGIPYEVRLADGLRTGMFLDQRDNRRRVRELASGKRVLNLFAYTGSFSVAALAGGATSAWSVDLSQAALRWAERNAARIGAAERHRFFADDAFDVLAKLRARGERFELIIVDPPSYSTSKRGRFRVTKDYAELCHAALEVLADEGTLVACLNHQGVTQIALRRFVQQAARDAGMQIEQLKDLDVQRDFPAPPGEEPSMKSVLCRAIRRPEQRTDAPRPRPKRR